MLVLLWIAAIVALGCWLLNLEERRHRSAPAAGPMTARDLSGLILIDYTPEMVLVSPRDVELPYSEEWSIDDVIDTLVEIDAL